MANRKGTLIDLAGIYHDLPDRRRPGEKTMDVAVFYDLPDRRRPGEAIVVGSVGSTVYYKMRARDSGLGPPPVYRVWVATDPTQDPPPPSPVGSWVDKTIVATWST